jgi:CDP-4-dehydro-6-deoxyglucose reductase, E1
MRFESVDLRAEVLNAARAFHLAKPAPEFVPGTTYIPVTGKVLDADDLSALIEASLDLWLTAGRFHREFEKELARKTGGSWSRMTVSGSAANLLAFTALTSPKLEQERILPGSEVITVAAGFPTTVAPIIQNQCVPVFVDVDLATHNIDVGHLEKALSPKTRAIMVAHTLGNPFNIREVMSFAEKHRLHVIEDCCDAFGATYLGKPVGTFGVLGTLSFYPAHHITTGEGGAVFGRSAKYMKILESYRDWGRDCWCDPGRDNTCGKRFGWQLGDLPEGYDHKYIYSHVGYNLKATDMQASIGLSQLKKLDSFVEKRRKNHSLLKSKMLKAGLEEFLVLPEATRDSEPSWFGFLMSIREGVRLKRHDVVTSLEARKIGTRLLFAGNLTKQPAFKGANYRIASPLTNTDRFMNDGFWIGVWPGLEEAHIDYMVSTLKEIVQENLK